MNDKIHNIENIITILFSNKIKKENSFNTKSMKK